MRLALLITGAVLGIAVAWLVVTGLLARAQLNAVRGDLDRLRAQIHAGDLPAARKTAERIANAAGRAHRLTTGPAWAGAAALPWLGDPVDTVRVVAAQADALGHRVLPALVQASGDLDPAQLRRPDGSFNLDRISAVAPLLARADSAMQRAAGAVRRAPGGGWLPPVGSARSQVLTRLTSLARTVHSADLAAALAPDLLGAHGPRRYFVAFQNEAEARGTGGIPGAFAIARTDHGRITFERFESDSALATTAVDLDLGPDYEQLFRGAGTERLYGNGNLSPHFPYAARIWAAMWGKHSGQRLDGVLAVDPTVLSYLLAVTGPAKLADGTLVSANNVVALSENTVYTRFPRLADQQRRKAYLLELARAASAKVLHPTGNLAGLVRAAGRAAGQRRVLLYSTDPDLERQIEQTSLAGTLPAGDAPYVGLSIVNEAGNKLDYYLDRSLTWQRSGCGSTRDVTVTIRLTNDVPAGPLAPYLTTRSDRRSYPTRPGDNRLDVSYYATAGAELAAITLDGRPTTASAGKAIGHPVFTADVELPRGATRTVVLHLREPAGHGAVQVLRQPLVRPLAVHLDDQHCG